ncbi:MotA/TolQ/ExbB proton channel family protein [Pelagicoccus sp. SDUM812003]|uniref:MotA/TolQ/ExbB proton channel family protein n=1 Tax=Pelagicoccus sp. SDUM812003 TaxID=3041267 RepID=UPI00280EA580|nr:MotA/TolQ/ExbB proton channel family protein [Pelagicoccus sp. SDUM812003]MDQ8204770.1 MotA/TolQ/ExbB proton channel family protein [Pelagicoccus sp. SDUM812003]
MKPHALAASLLTLATCSLFQPIWSQSEPAPQDPELQQIASKLKQEREDAIESYNRTLDEIETEKLEIIQETNRLERNLIDSKKQHREVRSETQSALESERRAKEQLDQLNSQSGYIVGVLREFSSNFLPRIDISEQQRFLPLLTKTNETARDEGASYQQKIDTQLQTLEASLDRLFATVGGNSFPATALDQNGTLMEGTALVFGPSSYFLDTSSSAGHTLTYNAGTIEPRAVSLSPEQSESIASFIRSGAGDLPLDPTGSALSLENARGGVLKHIQKGGWVGYVIITLGLVSAILSAVKLIMLQRERPTAPQAIDSIARDSKSGAIQTAQDKLTGCTRSVRKLLSAGIENARESSNMLEECLLSVILEYKLRLERYTPALALTAATAPLLGLLGTVVGMIKTFTLITVFGTGDAKSLSSGISEALITTELGLIVAVPALIMHGLILRMIKARTSAMESIAFEFVKSSSSQRDPE